MQCGCSDWWGRWRSCRADCVCCLRVSKSGNSSTAVSFLFMSYSFYCPICLSAVMGDNLCRTELWKIFVGTCVFLTPFWDVLSEMLSWKSLLQADSSKYFENLGEPTSAQQWVDGPGDFALCGSWEEAFHFFAVGGGQISYGPLSRYLERCCYFGTHYQCLRC